MNTTLWYFLAFPEEMLLIHPERSATHITLCPRYAENRQQPPPPTTFSGQREKTRT